MVLPFPHAGEDVVSPRVEDVILELLHTLLNQNGRWFSLMPTCKKEVMAAI